MPIPTASVKHEARKSPLSTAGGMLALRAAVMRAVRDFFERHDYLEVATPVWVRTPALETYIDAVPAGTGYLRTSPEFHMKRLLADGLPRVWQLGPCFRSGEYGHRHRPEFWLLEWYRAGVDYEAILQETRALLIAVAQAVCVGAVVGGAHGPVDLAAPWERLTVAQAFERYAGWNPLTAWDPERFEIDLVEKVEPGLTPDRPVVLIDYPIAEAALARAKPGCATVAERWELYVGGLELANAFSELTDASEQRRRFAACAADRSARGAPVYAPDRAFLRALEAGLPESAGVALGFDRLIMLLAGCDDIAMVSPWDETAEGAEKKREVAIS